MELERYYGGAKALLAQNEAFLKGITEALLLTLHHTRRGEQARRVWTDFDPHPREGGDYTSAFDLADDSTFQSTPPARGATGAGAVCQGRGGISIHAPREGGDFRLSSAKTSSDISIHAPREGGDDGLV